MSNYRLRRATIDDAATLAWQRLRMFEDMGVMRAEGADAEGLSQAFIAWLAQTIPTDTYRAWLIEGDSPEGGRRAVSGGGATVVPWPPGPTYPGGQLAFVYNVYTEPDHRGRGLARRIMAAIHAHCRGAGILSLALNASASGLPLYESMGYRVATSPMMFLSLDWPGV